MNAIRLQTHVIVITQFELHFVVILRYEMYINPSGNSINIFARTESACTEILFFP